MLNNKAIRTKICNYTRDLPNIASVGELAYVLSENRMYCFTSSHWNPIYGETDKSKNFQNRVHCEYCDSWVDENYMNCPNCGAPVNRGE